MAHRNRWFTELKNGWIFHGELLNNQRVMCNIDVDDWRIRDFDDVWTCLAYICTVFDGIVGLMYDIRDTH